MLNSGYEMPIVGLGMYSQLDETAVNSVEYALRNGYRKIDTAKIYGNEAEVGEGIRQSGVPREEIFLASKLYMNQYSKAAEAIDEALAAFEVDYLDLLLLHHPGEHDVEAYQAMEQAVKDGKVRSIGLSNYYIEELTDFLPHVTIMPALIQNEVHPYYQEKEVLDFFTKKGIVMEGWYPLGGRGHTKELFEDPIIAKIADKHQRSSAQIILRWHLQNGVVAIPGSSNPAHISENLAIFDFELTKEEMAQIDALERAEKHDWY
ncbi:aldo/keto reductase [Enterococcus sp. JM4C]|nr:aldo/keto reductase [Enterococcus sp. JM4C]